MNLKHFPIMKIPNLKVETDENTLNVFTQLIKSLNDTYKNIYDDLNRIKTNRVTSLPTASAEVLGRFYLLENTGAIDTLHICVYDLSDTSYKFQQVTLS